MYTENKERKALDVLLARLSKYEKRKELINERIKELRKDIRDIKIKLWLRED